MSAPGTAYDVRARVIAEPGPGGYSDIRAFTTAS